MVLSKITSIVGAGVLAFGCMQHTNDTQEIINNLLRVGYLSSDITIEQGVVYVGGDAAVTLAASREMLGTGSRTQEHYRTNNVISDALATICIDGSTFTGLFGAALDLAIQNYDHLPLSFAMARTPHPRCDFTINAVIQPGRVGGSAGFPSGGQPFGTIIIGGGLSTFSINTIVHVITHEIGHTIGLRHSDYFDRTVSCGEGGDEGPAGVGAIRIPGTPIDATPGGSVMNSCFRALESGELTATDISALTSMYGVWVYRAGDWDGDGRDNLAVRRSGVVLMDVDFSEPADIVQAYGSGNTEDQYLVGDWDGDGRDNLAVRRGNTIFMDTDFDGASNIIQSYGNGNTEDEYLVGDWDGDGRDNIAVRRSNVVFMDTDFNGASNIVQAYGFGIEEDQYLVGDWDGDGRDNIAVRRDSVVFMDTDFDGVDNIVQTYGNGNADHQYLVGDWDGDGRDNLAVRRNNVVSMDTDFDGDSDIEQTYGNGNAED